jgi:hypothetical protein
MVLRSSYIFSSKFSGLSISKKCAITACAFIAGMVLCDWVLYALLSALCSHAESGPAGMINNITRVNADVYVLGSSRAQCHYNDDLLGKKLNMSCYNAGSLGQGIPYIYGLTDYILHNHYPKLLIINIDAVDIGKGPNHSARVSALAPLMEKSKVIKSMIYRKSTLERLKYLSLSFRYNSYVVSIIENLFNNDHSTSGFEPLKGTMQYVETLEFQIGSLGFKIDPDMVELLQKTIQLAKKSGIKVLLANSPAWRPDGKLIPEQKHLVESIEEIARQENVPYITINLENTPLFRNVQLFKDPSHLNSKGADLFTAMFAEKIASSQFLLATGL